MFESLTEKLTSAMRHLRGVNKLSEDNIAEALKEVRTALLSADVHFRVAREFVERVQKECIGQSVIASVSPGQMVVKIIHDELVKLLGGGIQTLNETRPLKIMMVGLHGSGKTTSTAKLARHLAKTAGLKPCLVACDVYRPAAIDQLEFLAKQEGFLSYSDRISKDVPAIARAGMAYAEEQGANLVIFDTAGRLQIDTALIDEIKQVRAAIDPGEVLLVADAALGQEAVNVARTFNEAVQLTGLIMTKLDGDARGGAALSIKSITQVPIKFIGTGEKTTDFDNFYPDRLAKRILGMGDVVSLVEKAQSAINEKDALRMVEKMQKAEFDLDDLLEQIRAMKKLGPLAKIMEMVPGMSGMGASVGDKGESQMKRTEAILLSMTPHERLNPHLINGSRRDRVARGSGVRISDVNNVLKQYQQMRKMMRMMKGTKGKQMMKQLAEHHKSGGMF
ncbi:MAG: signal recognition particle protein [Verrucomicrobiota bacterium]|nr:signal recognition particle protein [Verrucomicrobiota bacterium]